MMQYQGVSFGANVKVVVKRLQQEADVAWERSDIKCTTLKSTIGVYRPPALRTVGAALVSTPCERMGRCENVW